MSIMHINNFFSALTPQRALWLSVAAALLTMGLKTGAWLVTGSVGFLSDALETLVNLAGAVFALLMVSYARQPADREHPYGHGKAEYFSVAFEGVLIFAAALAIIAAAVERLISPQPLDTLGLGTVLALLASLVNLLVARLLFRAGRRHRSVALETDARHLMSDVWMTAGVIIGVCLAGLSGWQWLDPLVAIGVALNILREGWALMRRSVDGMMDRALEPKEVMALEQVLAGFALEGCIFANFRTRQAGALRFAHVDIQVPGGWSVRQAHDLADAVEHAFRDQGVTLSTHIEPLGAHGRGIRQVS